VETAGTTDAQFAVRVRRFGRGLAAELWLSRSSGVDCLWPSACWRGDRDVAPSALKRRARKQEAAGYQAGAHQDRDADFRCERCLGRVGPPAVS
jgi:hypothetical protein